VSQEKLNRTNRSAAEMRRYEAAERWWRVAVLASFALAILVVVLESCLAPSHDRTYYTVRSVFFLSAWIGWCMSRCVTYERLRNLLGDFELCYEKAETAKEKAEVLRAFQSAMIDINTGALDRGIRTLKRITTRHPRGPSVSRAIRPLTHL
jgi:hypothetical protein